MEREGFDSKDVSKLPSHVLLGKLRLLDFDDLFVLKHLLEGQTIAATAKMLGLTQPAITQRVRKMERVFEEPLLQKVGRHVKLTKLGLTICLKASSAISMMLDISGQTSHLSLTLGCESQIAMTRLWPMLGKLRLEEPDLTFHLQVADEEHLHQKLQNGLIDAALTSMQMPSSAFVSEQVLEFGYAMVTTPGVAAVLNEPQDLTVVDLIDTDRSLPLFSTIHPEERAALAFARQWYLGSEELVLAATLGGHGVAVLPDHLITGHLSSGRLVRLFPELKMTHALLYLSYRKESLASDTVARLKKALEAL